MTTTNEIDPTAAPEDFMANLPKPQAEHAWLQQFVGEWNSEAECFMDPDGPPTVNKGTESIRSLGGFWIISEIKSDSSSFPYANLMTLGYDPEKGKYIGSWVDVMSSCLWKYEGSVSADGRRLILETVGFCPMNPGKLMNFREEMELKTPDHKVFTSSMQGEDGEWRIGVKGNAWRKS